MLDFEMGVEFGRAISTLRAHEQRISRVEVEVASLRDLVMRSALVAILSVAGIVLNLKAETLGEAGAAFLKGMLK